MNRTARQAQVRRRPRCFALVPCAGIGARAGAGGPKQYAPLAGRPWSRARWRRCAQVDELAATLVVLAPDDDAFERCGLDAPHARPRARLRVERASAARRRADTVASGLDALLALGARADDWVLVHDAARCLVRPEAVDAPDRGLPRRRRRRPAGAAGRRHAQALDGGERGDERVAATVPRTAIWAAQTPQMFRIGLLRDALRAGLARADLRSPTRRARSRRGASARSSCAATSRT